MNRFIPCILSIQTKSFCVLSKYILQSSLRRYSHLIPRILGIYTDLFHVFSVYKQIHSAYSQYKYRIIPYILWMCPNNFKICIWKELLLSQPLKGHYFKKLYVRVQLDPRPTRNYQSFCSSLTKKFFLHILIIHRRTFEFEYLGEFEFIYSEII